MGLLIADQVDPGCSALAGQTVATAITALSYGVLLQFAVEMWVVVAGGTRWLRLAPPVLTAAAVALTVAASAHGQAQVATADAIARYSLGTTGALLAALGLWKESRASSPMITPRHRRLLALGALVFVLYALVAGLVPPPAPFFPASHLNTATFLQWTHVPVQAFRALCGASLGLILSEAFVIEVGRGRRELERLREEFIAVVAHDLRNPINTIELSSELLLRRHAESDDRTHQLIDRIRASGHRLERMVADLLDAAQVEARRLSLQRAPTDVRSLILAVIDRSAGASPGHPVRAVLPDPLPTVDADAARLEQVLTNLLSNAGKYSREGTEIVVTATVRSEEVEVAVSNLGEGLTREDVARIFTRFYRAPGAAHKAAGLGIGLYIAKGLVEAHGGRIWVVADPGVTTFRFTLPRPGVLGSGSSNISS